MANRRTSSCVYDAQLGKFKVTKSKGKSISSSGYGVPHTTTRKAQNCQNEYGSENCDDKVTMMETSTSVYLFIEEALYLRERGMIEVFHPPTAKNEMDEVVSNGEDRTEEGKKAGHGNQMITQEMYDLMLNTLNIPLGIFLAYSHLRSQTYIVLRHTANRLDIIRKMEKECAEKSSQSTLTQDEELCSQKKESEAKDIAGSKRKRKDPVLIIIKKELRSDAFHAPSPLLTRQSVSATCSECSAEKNDGSTKATNQNISHVAFDVYNPNTNFRKTMPGLPHFCVVVTPFGEPSPTFSRFKTIIQSCEGIPLKIATVSDLGTMAMFGITDYGVPSI